MTPVAMAPTSAARYSGMGSQTSGEAVSKALLLRLDCWLSAWQPRAESFQLVSKTSSKSSSKRRMAAQIGGQAAAKNCITVGACGTTRDGSIDEIADYSSRGPTTDGRIKPDVMAPGTKILSACSRARKRDISAPDQLWRLDTGTSMATPLVAGCVAVLRQILRTGGVVPGAALLKAMLINGATILKNEEGQDIDRNSQGFGRVDLANSIIRTGHTSNRDSVQANLSDPPNHHFTREFLLSKYMKGQGFPVTLKVTF
ncbi:hypothetical protein N8T08_002722 [Aspergillus melleus]|uniref:Uncharacterized protein n=1 Tax=Aspergillus melleus TaxID=138277 RepID=A0ACC3B7T7_9EURO|nr:hypothetical protein N8T08_002722 [Aspergillus melleus]